MFGCWRRTSPSSSLWLTGEREMYLVCHVGYSGRVTFFEYLCFFLANQPKAAGLRGGFASQFRMKEVQDPTMVPQYGLHINFFLFRPKVRQHANVWYKNRRHLGVFLGHLRMVRPHILCRGSTKRQKKYYQRKMW